MPASLDVLYTLLGVVTVILTKAAEEICFWKSQCFLSKYRKKTLHKQANHKKLVIRELRNEVVVWSFMSNKLHM